MLNGGVDAGWKRAPPRPRVWPTPSRSTTCSRARRTLTTVSPLAVRRPAPTAPTNAALVMPTRASQPVAFGYTDLSGQQTTRTVLPLALVHPPQGVKLLAWCEERGDFRQFFVRAMQGLTLGEGDFSGDRMALLRGLLDKETSRS